MPRTFRKVLALLAPALAVASLASAPAQAAELHVTGERTALTPSTAAIQFLASQGITVAVTGGASIGSDGSLIFRITHGTVTTAPMNGRIFHVGGVQFSRAGSSLLFRDFQLVRKHDRAFLSALVNHHRLVYALIEDFAVRISGREAIVTGQLVLGAEAAHLFNELIGSNLVAPHTPIGTMTSTIRVAG